MLKIKKSTNEKAWIQVYAASLDSLHYVTAMISQFLAPHLVGKLGKPEFAGGNKHSTLILNQNQEQNVAPNFLEFKFILLALLVDLRASMPSWSSLCSLQKMLGTALCMY